MTSASRRFVRMRRSISRAVSGGACAIDDTVIDWDDRITRGALPHGLASALLIDEEDKQAQMVLERNYFVEALEEATPAVLGYGDGDEE